MVAEMVQIYLPLTGTKYLLLSSEDSTKHWHDLVSSTNPHPHFNIILPSATICDKLLLPIEL
jgi:hypothetical protein